MPPDPTNPARRDVLLPVTLGAVTAVLGLGVTALFRAGLASDTAARSLTVDLSTLTRGQEIILAFERRPILIRHRTAEDIARAEADDKQDFVDPQAQNANLPASAPALDINRRASPDGHFLVIEPLTQSDPCIALGDRSGDFLGWFSPCKGLHFDSSGRIRKGPGRTNFTIPPLIIEGTSLTLLPKGSPRPDLLDSLIGRAPASRT